MSKNKKIAVQSGSKATTNIPIHNVWIISVIIVFTFIVFLPSLQNHLLSQLDDQAYVTNNELIKDISIKSIIRIFKEDKGLYANYHPLTTLSLAVNYHFSGLNPFAYHLTNLILHLLNTLLVFIFIYRLSEKNIFVSLLTSLWFGIHPMHVESVAWVSERKDLLYTFFFLSSLICYLRYLKNPTAIRYLTVLLLFIFSVLSKAVAVSLPIVLLLLDYYKNRHIRWKPISEKIPFVIVSLVLGWYAVQVQAEGGATISDQFSVYQRILHGCYGFSMYIWKLALPVNLSAFYPFPYPLIHGAWALDKTPGILFITGIITLLIFAVTFRLFFKRHALSQKIVFGILFYFITIALVLQFIQVGRVIMADRYSYISYIGLFYLIAECFRCLIYDTFQRKPLMGKSLIAFIIVCSLTLGLLTYRQCKVWKNDETVWGNVIKIYKGDGRIVLAYFNRASWYFNNGNKKAALNGLLTLTELDPKDDNALAWIGNIYGRDLGEMDKAINYLERAHAANPLNTDVLITLGSAYGISGDHKKSLHYSLLAEKFITNNHSLYANIAAGYRLLGDTLKANQYAEKANALKTD